MYIIRFNALITITGKKTIEGILLSTNTLPLSACMLRKVRIDFLVDDGFLEQVQAEGVGFEGVGGEVGS